MAPFDRSHTSSHSSSIVTMGVSCTVFEIKRDIGRKTPMRKWKPVWKAQSVNDQPVHENDIRPTEFVAYIGLYTAVLRILRDDAVCLSFVCSFVCRFCRIAAAVPRSRRVSQYVSSTWKIPHPSPCNLWLRRKLHGVNKRTRLFGFDFGSRFWNGKNSSDELSNFRNV